MIFERLNRTDPERVFIVVQANETLAIDDNCQWELASASIDGVKVRAPDTDNLLAFVGVADAAIASGAYGLVQVYGYRSTSRVLISSTSINTGVGLVPVAGAVHFSSQIAGVFVSTDAFNLALYAVLGESIASTASGTVSRKIFLRAM
jgi:hypothetical protein